jgi:18S rRNA (adenine1779-N6/adenine1780-N6)-dimethyltransferase
MDHSADVAALAAVPMHDGGNEVGSDDADMGIDRGDAAPQAAARAGKHKYSQHFKSKILALLDESGFADKRSAKLSQDEFMQLLAAFNSRGIHFA